jgi:hypothetical protein
VRLRARRYRTAGWSPGPLRPGLAYHPQKPSPAYRAHSLAARAPRAPAARDRPARGIARGRREHACREIELLELSLSLARKETAQLESQLTHTRRLAQSPPRKPRVIPQRLPHISRLPPSQLPSAEPQYISLGSLFRPPLAGVQRADELGSGAISVDVLGGKGPTRGTTLRRVTVPQRPLPRLTGRPTIISASVLMGL